MYFLSTYESVTGTYGVKLETYFGHELKSFSGLQISFTTSLVRRGP